MMSDNNLTLEGFEAWLFSLPRCVSRFKENFPPELAAQLDFSPESLDIVGTWLIREHEKGNSRRDTEIVNGLVGYVGATFRINLDGKWNIHIDEPEFRFNNYPVIEGFDDLGSVICPIVSVLKTVEKGASWYMRVELEAWMNNRQK